MTSTRINPETLYPSVQYGFSHATLDEASGDQAAAGIVVALLAADAIEFEHVLRLGCVFLLLAMVGFCAVPAVPWKIPPQENHKQWHRWVFWYGDQLQL